MTMSPAGGAPELGGATTLGATTLGAAALGPSTPSLPRLGAGAIVGAIGFIVLSVGFAGHVVSGMALPPSQAAAARELAATTPLIALAGLAHLVVAAGLAAGRDLFRIVAVATTGIVGLAAAASAAMIVAGVDPFGVSGAARLSPGGIGILVIAACLYGVAAVLVGVDSTAD